MPPSGGVALLSPGKRGGDATPTRKVSSMAIRDIFTPDLLKATYAQGVSFLLDDGSPFPDELFEQAIDSAVSTLENELSIRIDPFLVRGERHDAIVEHKAAFYPFYLDHRPAREVRALSITFGDYPAVTLPTEWALINSAQAGQTSLIPTASTMGSFFFRSGVPILFGDVFSPYRFVPSYFTVDYLAGFYFESGAAELAIGETEIEINLSKNSNGDKLYHKLTVLEDGGASAPRVTRSGTDSFVVSVRTAPSTAPLSFEWDAHTVDPALLKAIGLLAALAPLDIAGDLIAGAGIGSFSVGVDGLSQSIATTASATSAGYGARIISYQTQLKALLPVLRAKYRMMNTFSI